jgi:hypothetical protein
MTAIKALTEHLKRAVIRYLCAEIRIRLRTDNFSKKAGSAANGVSAGFSRVSKFTTLLVTSPLVARSRTAENKIGAQFRASLGRAPSRNNKPPLPEVADARCSNFVQEMPSAEW